MLWNTSKKTSETFLFFDAIVTAVGLLSKTSLAKEGPDNTARLLLDVYLPIICVGNCPDFESIPLQVSIIGSLNFSFFILDPISFNDFTGVAITHGALQVNMFSKSYVREIFALLTCCCFTCCLEYINIFLLFFKRLCARAFPHDPAPIIVTSIEDIYTLHYFKLLFINI